MRRLRVVIVRLERHLSPKTVINPKAHRTIEDDSGVNVTWPDAEYANGELKVVLDHTPEVNTSVSVKGTSAPTGAAKKLKLDDPPEALFSKTRKPDIVAFDDPRVATSVRGPLLPNEPPTEWLPLSKLLNSTSGSPCGINVYAVVPPETLTDESVNPELAELPAPADHELPSFKKKVTGNKSGTKPTAEDGL
jgi:hypothetical protein